MPPDVRISACTYIISTLKYITEKINNRLRQVAGIAYGRRQLALDCNAAAIISGIVNHAHAKQVGELSHTDRAAAWRNVSGRRYCAPKIVGTRKLEA